MKSYRDYTVGSEGARFVDARLKVGNTLARMIAERCRASGAHCVSRLPANLSPEAVTRFTDGGIGNGEESRRWLTSLIKAHLASGPEALVVLEDALARRGDQFLDRLESAAHYYGDEVYRLLTMANASEPGIRTALRETESPHQLVCVFTRSGLHRSPSAEIEHGELEAWAERVEVVAVKAYDDEGYIVCSALSRADSVGSNS